MLPVEVLKELDIFEGLTGPELGAIAEIAELAEFPKGSVIFKENDQANSMYVLMEGNVAIQFEVGRHREIVVHSVGAGQAFGWSALVQPYRFTASAKCINGSKVVTIDRTGLRKLLDADCHMGFVLMEKLAALISDRLRDTRMQLISLIHG